MVGQSGRRGALMITMDVRHPDIEKFATMKMDKTKVTGANVSIKITDEFMEAVNKGETFQLRFPVDSEEPTYTKEVNAKELWDLVVKTARDSAEPGLMMWDNITKALPAHCYPFFKTITTNPCGEIPLSAGDSCRLISVNLYEHVKDKFKEECYFDFEEFRETVRLAQRMADDLVDLEIEKLTQIMEECDTDAERDLFGKLLEAAERGRRTGLGTHGLGDCLAALRLRYDSDEAVEMVSRIYEEFKIAAYSESVNLAKERGAFPDFNWELEKDCEFFDSFPEWLIEEMKVYGRRNISLLTCAPTGSVSIESQVSSGVEPIFRLFYTRRKKINHNENVEPDFIDKLGDKWKEYRVYHKSVKDAMSVLETEEIPEWFIESDDIDWIKRVAIQSAMQAHIDHSISSTINLPRDVQADEVGRIYFEGWRQGLKGLTVYREGSRDGVLVSDDASDSGFTHRDAAKRPEEIPCDIHHVHVKGEKWVIIVGLVDGKPYEVFGGRAEKIELDKSIDSGILTKKKFTTVPNRYSLDAGVVKINDIIKAFDNPDNGTMTRMLSLALRHGTRPNYIVEQIQKDKNESFASFSKVVARVLKTYIEDGQKASIVNRNCETQENCNFVYQEGCATCVQCGWAKCG
jgi:ribonucleoside-diphosphate reductase alpha chain